MPRGVYERKPRTPKAYPSETVARVQELYALGMTQAEIAEALATTQHVIWRLMKHHGLVPRAQVMRPIIRGARHPFWKGDAATYKAFHVRLYTARGTEKRCTRCGTTDPKRTYDWANLTGRYSDLEDYERMCRHCHRQYDRDRRHEQATPSP